MNRLLLQARQMHQRRINHFYLAPKEEDYLSARLLAAQLSLNQMHPAIPSPRRNDDAFDDEPDEYF